MIKISDAPMMYSFLFLVVITVFVATFYRAIKISHKSVRYVGDTVSEGPIDVEELRFDGSDKFFLQKYGMLIHAKVVHSAQGRYDVYWADGPSQLIKSFDDTASLGVWMRTGNADRSPLPAMRSGAVGGTMSLE